MLAWAQETATEVGDRAAEAVAEHAEPFYASAEFWVAVGVILFVVVTFRTIYRVATVALDDRAERIRNQIEEAQRLAQEAQALLATYERKQRDAAEEADTMLENARKEADRLAEQAGKDLERALKRREELAMERIAQAETAAVNEIRGRAVEVALEATRRLLADQTTGKRADALIDAAIRELPQKLH